jgi:tetratricopeptide (TPR) repeat protein
MGVASAVLFLVALTAQALAQAASSAPAKAAADVPPYERKLAEDDAKRVAVLEKKIDELLEAGKLPEAQAAARAILEVRQRVQGPDHWETAEARHQLRTLEQIAALPPSARAELAEATKLYEEVSRLFQRGRYADAVPLLRRALDIRRRHLGGEHPDVARAMHDLGFFLGKSGKPAEAQPLLEKALAIFRQVLGEDHPDTARGYDNLADNLKDQGRYAEALTLYEKALAICRQVLGEDHPLTASGYNNLALNLHAQGRYAEAQPLYEKALAICRQVLGEDHPDTAQSYNNVASNLQAQGRYVEAQPLYEKALAIRRKVRGEDHPDTAQSYNNVAGSLRDQRQCTEAQPLFEKALAIRRQALGEDHPRTATSYDNLALNLNAQGRYAEAQPLYEKALAIYRQVLGEDHPDTAISYYSLAYNLHAQGRYAEAEALWTRATDTFEIARLRSHDAGLGRASFTAARSSPFPPLAACLARADKPAEAWRRLEHGLARGLLDDMAALTGASLPQGERQRQQDLLTQLDQLDKQVLRLVSAAKKTEASRAQLQGLLKQRQAAGAELTRLVVARSSREIFPLGRIQQQLPADAALLAWVDVPGRRQAADPNGEHRACVVRHKGPPAWVKLPGSGPKGAWTKDDDDLPRQFQRALSTPAGEDRGGRQKLISRLAAQRLAPLESALRGDAKTPPAKHLLIEPAWWMAGVPIEALTDRYTVSYVPSGTMFARLREKRRQASVRSTVPPRLLALGDPVFTRPEPPRPPDTALPENGLLIARVDPGSNAAHSKIQSGDVLLAYAGTKLSSLDDLKTALASQPSAKPGAEPRIPVEVWRDGKTHRLHVRPGPLGIHTSPRPAKEELLAKRDGDRILRASRGKDWQTLPGTRREVEAIARLFDRPVTLLDSEASEQRLDALAASGELKRFRYLHFATHGEVNDRIALESALILAQDHLPDPVDQMLAGKYPYDGKLTAAEMRRWPLEADLVTLSACDTGLGQRLGGEGYLGFAQALFLAGARSVVLSLWKVDDTATALLMTRFYQNLLGRRKGLDKPMAKAAALREAKRWLRELTVEEAGREVAGLPPGVRGRPAVIPKPPKDAATPRPFADPYYWSAFILIGDPD